MCGLLFHGVVQQTVTFVSAGFGTTTSAVTFTLYSVHTATFHRVRESP